jgi:hypothetical protein
MMFADGLRLWFLLLYAFGPWGMVRRLFERRGEGNNPSTP